MVIWNKVFKLLQNLSHLQCYVIDEYFLQTKTLNTWKYPVLETSIVCVCV